MKLFKRIMKWIGIILLVIILFLGLLLWLVGPDEPDEVTVTHGQCKEKVGFVLDQMPLPDNRNVCTYTKK